MINQFDNSIPKIASRNGDPATVARQFARGYLGLQTHGGNDRISYREIQVKEFTPADIPVNTVAPTVTGTGFVGQNLTCNTGHLDPGRRASRSRASGTGRTRSRRRTRTSAPRARSTSAASPRRPIRRACTATRT